MFKRILVPVDGSAPSNAGLKSAIQLAKDQEASLVILHVVDDSLPAFTYVAEYLPPTHMDEYRRAIRENGERILDKAVSLARKTVAQVDPAMAYTRNRTVAHAILNRAEKSKADVIVLGTHGRRGLRRVLMGSDAEAVVREAAVPVLLVRGVGSRQRAMTKPKPNA